VTHLVQHLVSEGLAANPEGTAVSNANGDSLSFAQLDSLSNQFARVFRSLGVERNDRVALCLEKNISYLAAVIGALKSDAIYVPVYEKSPKSRALQILEDCRPTVCVVDKSTERLIANVAEKLPAEFRIVALGDDVTGDADATERDIRLQPETAIPCCNIDSDIAYILYTSGSTGKPNGVMVTHGNVLDYAAWGTSYFCLNAHDRILNTAPIYFDMSVFDIYCSLKAGATICLTSEKEYMFPGRLIDVAELYSVTFWKGVSSMLSYLSKTDAIHSDRLGSLKTIVFAGEALPSKHLAHWMQTYPRIRFYNGYGPTEATGISACYAIPEPISPDEEVPLGLACANTEIVVLREQSLEPCDSGERGEICIRGAGVSAGYWNDPKRTQARFVQLTGPGGRNYTIYRTGDFGYVDGEGLIWMTGRLDDQVKVRGFRIELRDVADALIAAESASDATVMLLPDRLGNDSLVAFFEAPSDVTTASVRQTLRNRLPAYMVPKICHRLDRLPRTERGKLDKSALRQLHSATLTQPEEV
jgi:L-proline---[L-prolyl-carrier protein] ligase